MFESRLTQLVLGLLGPEAVLFNDQVGKGVSRGQPSRSSGSGMGVCSF